MPATIRYRICFQCKRLMRLGHVHGTPYYLCHRCRVLEEFSLLAPWTYDDDVPSFDNVMNDLKKFLEGLTCQKD